MSIFWQFTVNGLVAGAAYALVALGISLQYRTSGFLNFAHGAYVAIGAYLAYWLTEVIGTPFILASLAAVLATAVLGGFVHWLVYSPLQQRKASSTVLLIASLGLYTIAQNVISLVAGDDVRSVGSAPSVFIILGARLTSTQLTSVILAVLLAAALWWLLRISTWGRELRAVGMDRTLAQVCGIHTARIDLSVSFVTGGLSAMAGVMIASDVSLFPSLGFGALLMGVVAAVVGGLMTPKAALFGGLLVGLSQHLVVGFISSRWQEAAAFLVLLGVLWFRPNGLFNSRTTPQGL
jgi:branched-subunit amino acid ABC-type transport system permease component